MRNKPNAGRINYGGNFCGHNPLDPQIRLAKPAKRGHGGHPRILTLLSERLEQYYWRPRYVLPSLNLANGSPRKQRTERREACIRLLRAILKFTDLASLRVGIPTKTGFMCLTLDYLAAQTGMTMRRAERAMQDLKAANLLTVRQPRELQPDGSWRGLAAVKAVSKDLFAVFGLQRALKKEQVKAVKRLKKRVVAWNEADGQNRSLSDVARVRLIIGGRTSPRSTPGLRKRREREDEEYMRAYTAICAELMQDQPDWPPDKIRSTAKQILDAQGRKKA